MIHPVVLIDNVTKKFRIHKIKETNIKYKVIRLLKREEDYYEDFIALKIVVLFPEPSIPSTEMKAGIWLLLILDSGQLRIQILDCFS